MSLSILTVLPKPLCLRNNGSRQCARWRTVPPQRPYSALFHSVVKRLASLDQDTQRLLPKPVQKELSCQLCCCTMYETPAGNQSSATPTCATSGVSQEPSRCPGSRRRRGTSSSKSEAEGNGEVTGELLRPSDTISATLIASCCNHWVLRAHTFFSIFRTYSLQPSVLDALPPGSSPSR